MINFSSLKSNLSYLKKSDIKDIERSFLFAEKKHKDQKRKTGEPYIIHPEGTALLAAKYKFDKSTVIACLLHDTLEDTDTTFEEIEGIFGKDIAELVDGVAKISSFVIKDKVLFFTDEEMYMSRVDNYRKLLLATAKDIRVIIVKLLDRLDNIQTLSVLPAQKRQFYAKESIEIYAQIAERIGLPQIKRDLEDISFPHAYPKEFKEFKDFQKSIPTFHKNIIENTKTEIQTALKKSHIKFTSVYGRIKHDYSAYKKLKFVYDYDISKLYDLNAMRIILNSVEDCYKTLGVIHSLYTPLPTRIYDMIARPKQNGYQSIHTTVKNKDGDIFEVQIRTAEMHEINEYGLAAHWHYKENSLSESGESRINKNLLEWQKEIGKIREFADNKEFLSYIKVDLFSDQIFVFSPKGDIISLPKNATPIDFAYRIHSKVGDTCFGVKINNRIAEIGTTLKNGDLVEVITNQKSHPRQDWLNFAKTSEAKQKIRHFLRTQNEDILEKEGDRIIKELLKKYELEELSQNKIDEKLVSSRLPYNTKKDALVAIAEKHFSPTSFLKTIYPTFKPEKRKVTPRKIRKDKKLLSGIHSVFANCCKPKIGDDLVGYIGKEHVIKIHKRSCKHLKKADQSRFIDIKN